MNYIKVAIIIAGKNVPAVVSLTILAVMLYGRWVLSSLCNIFNFMRNRRCCPIFIKLSSCHLANCNFYTDTDGNNISNQTFYLTACTPGSSPTRPTWRPTLPAPWWLWQTCWPPSPASSCPPLSASWPTALTAWLPGIQVGGKFKEIWFFDSGWYPWTIVQCLEWRLEFSSLKLFSFQSLARQTYRRVEKNNVSNFHSNPPLMNLSSQAWNNTEGSKT